MSDESQNNVLANRVSLPKPDVDNITVLSENLPNEPVLPWHRFDSPWLEQEQDKDSDSACAPESESETQPTSAATQQLELELPQSEEISKFAATSEIASVDTREHTDKTGPDSGFESVKELDPHS
ncbi:MAG: hypothetical protein ACFBSF_04175 [Leptolyngbyaceae cyanobacterium]